MNVFEYLLNNTEQIISLLIEHIKLTSIAVGFALFFGVLLGILISYVKNFNKPVLAIANVVQAIPSMALLGFMIPLLGIGTPPAIVAVTLYSLLPIIKNTYIGIDNINPQTIEAANGIGLTKFQVLSKIQIPLALPVIMAGVRISAVTAVGLMTMAAFIGAGGLGYLVFSGIRTVNNGQILAGAIPACFLALAIDFLAGTIEKLVTPVSLQKGDNAKKYKQRSMQKVILSIAALVIILSFVFTSLSGIIKNDRTIVLGTKDFTEQHILGNLVADMIEEHTNIAVDRKIDLGGTQVCFSALVNNDIDMYIDYSGTVYGDTLKYPPNSNMQEVYDISKADLKELYNIEVLKQMAFNNTYTLAVTQETAQKYNLTTISDFAKIAKNLKSGSTFEFLNREDGFPGVERFYGFKMGQSVALDSAPRYIAIDNQDVDVIDAFSTDGLLQKFNLVTLVDDKNFFPPFFAMPLVRNETYEEYPELIPIMEELGAALTNDVMMALNYKVDELQQKPENVAKDFLVENGLISAN